MPNYDLHRTSTSMHIHLCTDPNPCWPPWATSACPAFSFWHIKDAYTYVNGSIIPSTPPPLVETESDLLSSLICSYSSWLQQWGLKALQGTALMLSLCPRLTLRMKDLAIIELGLSCQHCTSKYHPTPTPAAGTPSCQQDPESSRAMLKY